MSHFLFLWGWVMVLTGEWCVRPYAELVRGLHAWFHGHESHDWWWLFKNYDWLNFISRAKPEKSAGPICSSRNTKLGEYTKKNWVRDILILEDSPINHSGSKYKKYDELFGRQTGKAKQRNMLVNFCDKDKCWGRDILVIQISTGL